MPGPSTEHSSTPNQIGDPPPRLLLAAHYGLSLLLVLFATALAFAMQRRVSASNVTLVYVLPIVISASFSGWGPSLLAVIAGATAFDYLFTEPYYSLAMTKPAEVWAIALFLAISLIVSLVSAQSRRRAFEASEAAEKAEALLSVAHVAIHSATRQDVLKAAAAALHQIFRAPAIIFIHHASEVEVAASAGGARCTEADLNAARGALASRLKTRGQMYPYVQTCFDFWPVSMPADYACVLGVDFGHSDRGRLESSDDLVEGVAAYIASALARNPD